jgi:hypothetical protein
MWWLFGFWGIVLDFDKFRLLVRSKICQVKDFRLVNWISRQLWVLIYALQLSVVFLVAVCIDVAACNSSVFLLSRFPVLRLCLIKIIWRSSLPDTKRRQAYACDELRVGIWLVLLLIQLAQSKCALSLVKLIRQRRLWLLLFLVLSARYTRIKRYQT